MSPRLQCLNAIRQAGPKLPASLQRASLSTSARLGVKGSSSRPAELPNPDSKPQGLVRRTANPDKAARSLNNMLRRSEERRGRNAARSDNKEDTVDSVKNSKMSMWMGKMQTRRFAVGDVYAPHDLSPIEMSKWRAGQRAAADSFDLLAMNPVHEYKNFAIMSEFVSLTGRINHGSFTGLRPVNQRRLSKAIRRSIGLGLMPSAYRHPEILMMVQLSQK